MASGTATPSMAVTNIMLAIDEKKTSSVELYYPVRYYVLVHFSEADFQNLAVDLQALNNLRSVVENPTGSLTYRRDLLIRYFKALCSASSILPFSPHPDHINAVLFTWFDAFKKNTYSSQPNLDLEKASVMFNLGAVYSQIGLSSDRSTTKGIKQAVDNFRSAAGAFEYLRVRLAERAPATLDISMECAWALERFMLGQARECIYQNKIAKGSSHGVCAKISGQVGLFYKQAFDGLNVVALSQNFPLSQHFDDNMLMTQIQLKAAIFSAESCFMHSLELHEKEKIGEEIARLGTGITALADVQKFFTLKGTPSQLLVAVNKLKSTLNKNLNRAIEENASVYKQSYSFLSALTTSPAVYLPKPMPIDKVLDASKEDVFAHIVLDASAGASPKYTGMAEKMIGLLLKKLQVGSELASGRLEKMHLPESIIYLEEIATLPEELKVEMEEVQISGGAVQLVANLQILIHSRKDNQELFGQCREIWLANPKSSALAINLWTIENAFGVNLQRAADSEQEILHSLREHLALLSILDLHQAAAVLQPLLKPNLSFDANESAIVGTLKRTLIQLKTVVVQRVDLEDMLREIITKLQNYDTLQEHMKCTESHLAMEKLNDINVGISESFKAQHQILEYIKAKKDEFSAIFNLEDFKASTEKRIEKIQAALGKYYEIKQKINEGLKLNETLQALAVSLLNI